MTGIVGDDTNSISINKSENESRHGSIILISIFFVVIFLIVISLLIIYLLRRRRETVITPDDVEDRDSFIEEYLKVRPWNQRIGSTSELKERGVQKEERVNSGKRFGERISWRADIESIEIEERSAHNLETIDELSEMKCGGKDSVDSGHAECAICLESMEGQELVCESNNEKCRHVFHKACMVAWLLKHDECPTCREPYLKNC